MFFGLCLRSRLLIAHLFRFVAPVPATLAETLVSRHSIVIIHFFLKTRNRLHKWKVMKREGYHIGHYIFFLFHIFLLLMVNSLFALPRKVPSGQAMHYLKLSTCCIVAFAVLLYHKLTIYNALCRLHSL